MGSTKSTTEMSDEAGQWESQVDTDTRASKVPLRITEYRGVTREEEHSTTGSYRSNQVEVVKKQVATMMDDSSEAKEEYYKNNSNSKNDNNDAPFDLGHRFSYSPVPSEHSLKHGRIISEHNLKHGRMPSEHNLKNGKMVSEQSLKNGRMPSEHSLKHNRMISEHSLKHGKMPSEHSLKHNRMMSEHSLKNRRMSSEHSLKHNRMISEHSLKHGEMPSEHSLKHNTMMSEHSLKDGKMTPVPDSQSYFKVTTNKTATPRERANRDSQIAREEDQSTDDVIVFGDDISRSQSQVTTLNTRDPSDHEDFTHYNVDEVCDYLDPNCDLTPCVNMQTYLPERKSYSPSRSRSRAGCRQGALEGFANSRERVKKVEKPDLNEKRQVVTPKRQARVVKSPRKMASNSRVSSRASGNFVSKRRSRDSSKVLSSSKVFGSSKVLSSSKVFKNNKVPSTKAPLDYRHTASSIYRLRQNCRRTGKKMVTSARPDNDVITERLEAPRMSGKRPMMRMLRATASTVIGRVEQRDVTNNRCHDAEASDVTLDYGTRRRTKGWRRVAAGSRTNDVITHAAAPPPTAPRRPMMRMCDVTRYSGPSDVSNNKAVSDADREPRLGCRRWTAGPRRVAVRGGEDVLAVTYIQPSAARRSMMRMVRSRVSDQNVLLRAEPGNANRNNGADDATTRFSERGRCGELTSHRITKACGVRARDVTGVAGLLGSEGKLATAHVTQRVATGVADLMHGEGKHLGVTTAHVSRRGRENTSERIFCVRNEASAKATSGVSEQTTVTS